MPITPKEQAEVLRRLQAWLDEEGLSTTKPGKAEEAHEHVLVFKYPVGGPTSLTLLRPKGRRVTVLLTGTTVSPEHLQQLQAATPETRLSVFRALRRTAFAGGQVGFNMELQGEVPLRWSLEVAIYDDGLSQHSFNAALRTLLTKHLEAKDAFNEALGARGNGGTVATTAATGSSGYI